MFIDDVVLAGLVALVGTLVFLGGVLGFIYMDAQKKKKQKQ